jgi:hypothetical protein
MMKKLADYFAGQALAGLTSDNPDGPYNPKLMAQLAWATSDAMMVQRGIRREQYDEDMSTTEGK